MQLLTHKRRGLHLAIDGEFGAFVVQAKQPSLWNLIHAIAHREMSLARELRRRSSPKEKKKATEKNARNRVSRVAYYRNRYHSDEEYRKCERARKNRTQNNNHSKTKARRAARPEEVKAKEREWFRNWTRNKRRTDPNYCLGNRLRSRMWHALDGQVKSARTEALTGCTLRELRAHLESKFVEGMSWENKHLWEIDHIMPCASFVLSDSEQQRKCFHWTNLQPLWQRDNRSKSAKLPDFSLRPTNSESLATRE